MNKIADRFVEDSDRKRFEEAVYDNIRKVGLGLVQSIPGVQAPEPSEALLRDISRAVAETIYQSDEDNLKRSNLSRK
jgi:hypothetical protein